MPRKLKKGYFVRGHFVAEGSELDMQLKAELKGTDGSTKTELKRESDELQDLGKELLTLRSDLFNRLSLPEKLHDALLEAKKITNFEGKRRQMQYVGKLMRKLEESQVEAVRKALDEQSNGSAEATLSLHLAEQWRDRLIGNEESLAVWLEQFPRTDTQQIRALIRQARKDAAEKDAPPESQGLAPRKTRAYRELFQLVREQLEDTKTESDAESHEDDA